MLDNLLTSGFGFNEDEHALKLQYKFFNSLLFFNIIVVFLASLARLSQGNIPQVFIDLSYSSIGLAIILLTRKYRNLFQLFVKIVMIMSFIIVTLSFYFETNSVIGISWYMIQLIVVVFLTDKRFSYMILILSIIAIATITYLHQDKGYDIFSAIYASIPLAVSFVFLFLYEKRNSDSQQLLLEKNEKLYQLTHNLEELVQIEVEKNKTQLNILAKQSQSAALGEMMDAIAHQWKQPLAVIKMHVDSLWIKEEMGDNISKSDIATMHKKVDLQIDHLLNTINEFRSFFRPNPKFVETNIYEVLDLTLALLKDHLIQAKIEVEVFGDKDISILCIPNEIKHIFINLINNSKDAFIEKKIKERKISFYFEKYDDKNIIEICDNAGGINEDILERIFNANFTTKDVDKGTGIGLYMTKQIIEKLNSTIDVKNTDNGVCFKITFMN